MLIIIKKYFGGDVTERPTGNRFYARSFSGNFGIIVSREPRQGGFISGRTEALVEFPGQSLQFLGMEKLRLLLTDLADVAFRASMVHLYIDDFTKTLTPQLVIGAIERGDFTGFRVNSPRRKLMNDGCPGEGKNGTTCYLGRRGSSGSGKFLRVYDKWFESQGLVDSVRAEVEFAGHYAKQVFQRLLVSELDLWGQIIPGRIDGAVSFIDRSGHKRVPDCERLPWWNHLVGGVTRMQLACRQLQTKTFDRAVNWLYKQVAPTLAMVLDWMSQKDASSDEMWKFFYGLWADGESRFNDEHKRILSELLVQMKV